MDDRRFEKLAKLAGQEPSPAIDVTDRVMARVRSLRQYRPLRGQTFGWVAAGAAAVAIPLVIGAILTIQHAASPMASLFGDPLGGVF